MDPRQNGTDLLTSSIHLNLSTGQQDSIFFVQNDAGSSLSKQKTADGGVQ